MIDSNNVEQVPGKGRGIRKKLKPSLARINPPSSKRGEFKVFIPPLPPREKVFESDLFQPIIGRDNSVYTSVGMESERILDLLLKPGEYYLKPDFYSFIALPLSPDAEPGTERERILTITRTDRDRLGPQLANQLMADLQEELKTLEKSGMTWRWITVEALPDSTWDVERFLRQRKVNPDKGEGLSLIAISSHKPDSLPPPKLPEPSIVR